MESTFDYSDPIFARLQDQISWYDAKSSRSQRAYKRLKLVSFICLALIPFLSALHVSDMQMPVREYISTLIALLAVLALIIEGVLQLNQYQLVWISYRATAEALQNEKYLYLGRSGPYATSVDPRSMLAERIQGVVSSGGSGLSPVGAIQTAGNTKWGSIKQSWAETVSATGDIPDETIQRVFEAIKAGASSGWELSKVLALSPDQTLSALNALERRGVVTRNGPGLDGYYYLTTTGFTQQPQKI